MVRYIGVRLESGCKVWRVDEQGKIRALAPSKRSRNFPSDQWEWGYGGSGPADLAWALCMDASADVEMTRHVYQAVKWQIVALLARDQWMLTGERIRDAMDRAGQSGEIADTDMIDLGLTNPPVEQRECGPYTSTNTDTQP